MFLNTKKGHDTVCLTALQYSIYCVKKCSSLADYSEHTAFLRKKKLGSERTYFGSERTYLGSERTL